MYIILLGMGITRVDSPLRFYGFCFIKDKCMHEEIPQNIGIVYVCIVYYTDCTPLKYWYSIVGQNLISPPLVSINNALFKKGHFPNLL